MARGYAGEADPDKGKPYRHTRQKIRLLLTEPELPVYEKLLEIILHLMETRPEEVLDSVTAVLDSKEGKHE